MKTYRRSKVIRLIIHQDGKLVVTAPKWASKKQIERFIEEKQDWISAALEKARSLPIAQRPDTRQEYLLYKDKAAALVRERIEHFNAVYGFAYKRITIRNQKTRWGSCSSSGTLSFNYRLALLPKHQADYIIVHELCHLKEMNHSARFWKLVARMIPDHAAIRRELRKSRRETQIA